MTDENIEDLIDQLHHDKRYIIELKVLFSFGTQNAKENAFKVTIEMLESGNIELWKMDIIRRVIEKQEMYRLADGIKKGISLHQSKLLNQELKEL